ncbi:hypothetical protein A3844_10145 [Paenibacillus helianthi]|uniref:Fibronectin type-III domain-containing protein n=2 Tax=Paenibacillus helianthi TaxID=1349432 RepID=A0ABX3EPV8_9BACL|nr:hypothetical protein A3844_10145 [Paenibacillus helianthi]
MTVDPTAWTNKFVTITLAGGTDADSGFQKYQYKINQDGEWKDYTAPFVIDTEGLYNVYARSVDNVFNHSEEVTGVAKVDKTNPPKPIMTIEPSKWTNQSVSITLSGGTDTDKGFPNSGFQKYQYKIDNGEWKDYTAPIIVDTEGLYKFVARSVDIAANLSEEVSGEAKIDRTKPTVPIMTIEPLKWTNLLVTITLTGGNDTDKGFPNSGFQKYQYKIDDEEWKDYTQPVIVSEAGLYNVYARSIDNVNLISDEVSGQAKVDKTKPSTPTGFSTLLRNYDSLKITWSPSSDNVGVTGYDIYLGTKLIGTTTLNEYTYTGLSSDRTYKLKVVAKDEAGNFSAEGVHYAKTPLSLISSSTNHTLYVKADGTVWAWGSNGGGQLGDGTTTSKTTATQVLGLTDVVAVAAGSEHSLALKADGSVWSWGSGSLGALGTGATSSYVPTRVPGLEGIIAITASQSNSYALKSDGTVWAWGGNHYGQLGNGSIGYQYNKTSPVKVNNLTGVTALAAGMNSFVYALKTDGRVWGWGANYYNNLGIGDTQQVEPKQLDGLTEITRIVGGTTHGVFLKADGSVWMLGTVFYKFGTPYKVPGLSEVKSIAGGSGTSFAVKSDGSVWAWGINSYGQLGNGKVTPEPEQTDMVRVTDLSGVSSVAGGAKSGIASKTDGSIWTWGGNNEGHLGDGTTVQRLVPVQVQENQAPLVTLTYPLGTQESPSETDVSNPSILWNQKDAELTKFTAYQVQVLDESGGIVSDSGEVKTSLTTTTGTWLSSLKLPTFEPLQVKVRVKDESLWSEWSNTGWMEIASMFSLKLNNSLTNTIELSRPTIKSGEPTTVKLSVYGNVYGDDDIENDLLNGIAKVRVSGYTISSTESSGKFGDVELSASGNTVIDVQFHDGIAEIPLTLTVPGKQTFFSYGIAGGRI